jgi:hypothetical protein
LACPGSLFPGEISEDSDLQLWGRMLVGEHGQIRGKHRKRRGRGASSFCAI